MSETNDDPVQEALSRNWVDSADVQLAGHLCQLGRLNGDRELLALLALASAQVRQGDVCLPLRGQEQIRVLGLGRAVGRLAESGLVASPDEPGEARPLVLDRSGLYLARYHAWEQRIIQAISRRLTAPDRCVDEAALREGLGRLFPGPAGTPDWQRVAAVLALLRPLCVISGGPGTGKTWTVARILGLLRGQPGGEALRIGLAAPTGKAAGRLRESITAADEALAGVLPEPVTLHRLLGMRPGRVHAGFDGDRPLPLDVLVVDEVSMVDMPMLARLLAALPGSARLILLGDHHQLASVQAGRVMADLCGPGGAGFSPAMTQRIESLSGDRVGAVAGLPPMADHLVELVESRRFAQEQGIGRLARAIRAGDDEAALATLARERDVGLLGNGPGTLQRVLREWMLPSVEAALASGDPAEALATLERVGVLCALREGPQGVHWINNRVEQLLGVAGQAWYPGRRLMITANEPRLGLYNGDIGMVLPGPDGRLRVFFPDAGVPGGIRSFLPGRLPPHETVFAMTIHKSQGSEFERVILVLPDTDATLLTRELLYTGVTRARRIVNLCAGEEVLRMAIGRVVQRNSGLHDRLWGDMP